MHMGEGVTFCAWIRGRVPLGFVSLNDLQVPRGVWVDSSFRGRREPRREGTEGSACEVPTVARDGLPSCFVNICNLPPSSRGMASPAVSFYPRSHISRGLCTCCDSTRAVFDALRGALSGPRADSQMNASRHCGREGDRERVP